MSAVEGSPVEASADEGSPVGASADEGFALRTLWLAAARGGLALSREQRQTLLQLKKEGRSSTRQGCKVSQVCTR